MRSFLPRLHASLVLPLLALFALFFAAPANAVDIFATGGTYIYKFDSDTGARTVLLNQSGASFWGVAADSTGNVYAANFNASTVVGLTSSGGAISGFTTISNPNWNNIGVAYNPVNSTLAVAKYAGTGTNPNIYSLAGGTATGTASFSLPTNIQGIAYDAAGNLYAAQNSAGNVSKNGTTLYTLPAANNPEFVFVDQAASQLYVTANVGKVYRTDLNGTLDTSFGSSGSINVSGPKGVAVAGGYLFVTSAGSINKYDLSGTLITSGWGSSVSGSFTGLTAFSVAVPEPSTYALAAIATGVLGFAARRRRKS